MLTWLDGYLETGIAICGTVVVLICGRLILKKAIKDRRTLPYYRQFFSLLLVIVGIFVTIAMLPMQTEVRMQILSVLGILLSAILALSSTTLVGNAMAGAMLRMTKGYRAGDFIQFDDLLGRVTDIGLFQTEMQLVTRDTVSVPNILLVQKAVRVTRKTGTFVNASVSIGYGVPHNKVESALKDSALACELKDPFVLVEDLMDHAVCYRVYGLLEESSELLSRSSRLREAMLDALHARGVEIASPSIVDRREFGSEHRYEPPSVRLPGVGKDTEQIEELAFDLAEEAATIEQLYAMQERLDYELGNLESEDARNRKPLIRQQRERIKAEIERREVRQEEGRLEENASE